MPSLAAVTDPGVSYPLPHAAVTVTYFAATDPALSVYSPALLNSSPLLNLSAAAALTTPASLIAPICTDCAAQLATGVCWRDCQGTFHGPAVRDTCGLCTGGTYVASVCRGVRFRHWLATVNPVILF